MVEVRNKKTHIRVDVEQIFLGAFGAQVLPNDGCGHQKGGGTCALLCTLALTNNHLCSIVYCLKGVLPGGGGGLGPKNCVPIARQKFVVQKFQRFSTLKIVVKETGWGWGAGWGSRRGRGTTPMPKKYSNSALGPAMNRGTTVVLTNQNLSQVELRLQLLKAESTMTAAEAQASTMGMSMKDTLEHKNCTFQHRCP